MLVQNLLCITQMEGPGTVKDGRSPGPGLCVEKIQNALTSKQIQVGGDLIHQIHLTQEALWLSDFTSSPGMDALNICVLNNIVCYYVYVYTYIYICVPE